MSRRKAPQISAEARVVLSTLVPKVVHDLDTATRKRVMDAARLWAESVPPQSAEDARALLRAAAFLGKAALREDGTLVTEDVLDPDTIERLAVQENPDRRAAPRGELRRRLTRMGRAANPACWPMESQRLKKAATALPYSGDDEEDFLLTGDLWCRPGKTAETAVICLAPGAGISGAEIGLMTPHDVVPYAESALAKLEGIARSGGDRLVVNVKGKNPRVVPIREPYTELTRRLLEDARGGPFFNATYTNRVYCAAARIPTRDGDHLRLRRARTTWLRAQIQADVRLDRLRVIAGPLSANTLDDLINMCADQVDPADAVLEGLKA